MEAEKNVFAVFEKKKEGIDWDRTRQWIAKADLKGYTDLCRNKV